MAGVTAAWLLLGGSGAPLQQHPSYNSFLGASEFAVGENRFPFAMASLDGDPLTHANVTVHFFQLQGTQWTHKLSRNAEGQQVEGVTPHLHEDGFVHIHDEVRSYYVTTADFQTAGVWQARFALDGDEDLTAQVGPLAFNVLAEPVAPSVGEPAPAIDNLTVHDVTNIDEIESRVPPDNMHNLSVAQALELGRPFMVIWSAPMFCITAICGPVLDAAVRVQEKLGDRLNFIHIEPWNLEVARNEGRLVPTDDFLAWNLETEPWVFVVDDDGLIHARFEGLVTDADLERAAVAVLSKSP